MLLGGYRVNTQILVTIKSLKSDKTANKCEILYFTDDERLRDWLDREVSFVTWLHTDDENSKFCF